MIDKIDTNQMQNITGHVTNRRSELPVNSTDSSKSVSLQFDLADLLNKVTENEHQSEQAVQLARELLSSGLLESPENIRSAAQNILDFGV